MSFDRPILIYSDYCIHSKNYLQMLMKHPDIYETFIRMNIDVEPQTKQRPSIFYKIQEQLNKKIVRVPTIIIKNDKNNEILLLSDKDAFKWLDFKINLNKNGDTSIKGFNINEMASFSDGYSKYNINSNESTHINDANEQSFKFYKNINGQRVLPGENFQVDCEIKGSDSFLDKNFENSQKIDHSTYKNMENTRETFLNSQNSHKKIQQLESMSINQPKVNVSEFNNRVNNYQQSNQSQQRIPQIDFTSQNFGLSQELGGLKFNKSQKLQEFDSKLNQLMMDRG